MRLNSNLKPDETEKLISSVVERKIDLLWKSGDIVRVLNTDIPKSTNCRRDM